MPTLAATVQELLAKSGIGLIYLPRYSPEFNPIEHAGAKVKERLNAKAARTLEALETELKPARDTMLTDRSWAHLALHDIVAQAVEPYCSRRENRIHVQRPRVQVPPRTALALAMALQELATMPLSRES